MSPAKKRIVFSVMAAIFLLAACGTAPAATQDMTLIEQAIEKSVASTVAAQKTQGTEGQPIPTLTPPSVAEPVETLPDQTDMTGPATEPATEAVTETTTPDPEAQGEEYCNLFLSSKLRVNPTDIKYLESQLEGEPTATIKHRVNLRTKPSLRSRIILALKPGAEVEIIDGPRKTRFDNGTYYVWWQVRLPGGPTGWAAEISVCRQFYFMEPT